LAVRLVDYQPGVGPKLAAALRLMVNATEQTGRDRAGALVVQVRVDASIR
jgi:hypothetical protein